MKIKVADVVFRDDLYPRLETNPTTVQKYADTIDVLPPIEVNQNNELIDGWHRWTAHKKNKLDTIDVKVTETTSEGHFLEIAIQRNATFGLAMSNEDKKDMARKIYNQTPTKERPAKKKSLAKLLSVGESTIQTWLSRIDKDEKEVRRKRIFDMWLACFTQQEIADEEGMTKQAIALVCQEFPELEKLDKLAKAAAEHATDFDAPIYNVWKQQTKSKGSSHFGNSEVRWLDNLLYMYTDPFDIVVDPFAGGGSTIDICKKRLRRYLVSDRAPIVEREDEIAKNDLLVDGTPKPPQWGQVKLVYLDPPYWKQAEGKYSEDKTDLANMSLADFTSGMTKIVKAYAAKMSGAYIALIIQPTQWATDDEHNYTDHVADITSAKAAMKRVLSAIRIAAMHASNG